MTGRSYTRLCARVRARRTSVLVVTWLPRRPGFRVPAAEHGGCTRNDSTGPNLPGTPQHSMQVRVVPRLSSKRPGKVRIRRVPRELADHSFVDPFFWAT